MGGIRRNGSIFAMLFGGVALVGVLGVSTMNLVVGPVSTAAKVTHQNHAQNDLLMNAKIVVMNASTRPNQGDEDGDGYVEPVPFIPTSASSCNITLPAGSLGGCLPSDIGAIQTDPWGTQYMYCVWDHGDPASSTNRITGEDSTSGAVLAIISAGPNKRFETPCRAYDGDPATNDDAVNPDGIGDDLIQIYTYAAAVAGSGGLWELKQNEPETAIINKKLEIGDMATGMGFAFDTETGQGEFPYVKTDFIASKTGGNTPVTMVNNIALDGNWLSGDGGNEGVFVTANGNVGIGTTNPLSKMHVVGSGGAGDSPTLILSSLSGNPFEGGRIRFIEGEGAGSGLQGAYIHYDATGSSGTSNKLHIGMHPTADSNVANDVNAITILRNGLVGIGTANPAQSLHMYGRSSRRVVMQLESANTGVTDQQFIAFVTGGGDGSKPLGDTPGVKGWAVYARGENYGGQENDFGITYRDGTTWRQHFVIDADTGNVGIGTISPASKLHVIDMGGNGLRFDTIKDSPPSPTNSHDIARATIDAAGISYPELYLRTVNSSATSTSILSSGNLYVGTTGSVQDISMGYSNGYVSGNPSQPNHVSRVFVDNGTGNVGIGTTNPTQKLQVNGLIDVTNNRILRVATPTAATDAANKSYVDSMGGKSCASGQLLKWNGTTWACAGDSIGMPDNLGAGGATTGTLYSNASNGYGYVGQDGNNLFRFDTGAGTDRILTRVAGTWVLQTEPTVFRPFANNAVDLGTSGARWRNGFVTGTMTAGTFAGSGASLTALNASNISTGTVPVARIGTGTKNTGTFYRGDGTFATTLSATGLGNWIVEGGGDGTNAAAISLRNTTVNNRWWWTNRETGHLWLQQEQGSTWTSAAMGIDKDSQFVGIGVTAPRERLHVNGNLIVAGDKRIYFSHDGDTNSNNDYLQYLDDNSQMFPGNAGWLVLLADTDRGVKTWENPTFSLSARGGYFERMVSIGTTTPSARLHVRGSGSIFSWGNFNPNPASFLIDDGGQQMYFDGNSIIVDNGPMLVSTSGNNALSLGANSTERLRVAASGNVVIYGASTTCTIGSGTGSTNCTSDRRLKNNIQRIDGALAKVSALEGVSFDWKKTGEHAVGLVAQDVEKVFPEVVTTDEETGMKSVAYSSLVAPLIEAIKELKAENDALKKRIDILEVQTTRQ